MHFITIVVKQISQSGRCSVEVNVKHENDY